MHPQILTTFVLHAKLERTFLHSFSLRFATVPSLQSYGTKDDAMTKLRK